MTIFRDLHLADAPLLLPNAWDVGSALAFAAEGFPAIGTTSFGGAASAGRPDGTALALVAQLRRLPVHITADIEDGYSDDPAAVADLRQDPTRGAAQPRGRRHRAHRDGVPRHAAHREVSRGSNLERDLKNFVAPR